VEEVREAIAVFQPDVVAVELDQARFATLKRQVQDPNVSDVIEARNFTQLLVQWVLAYLQRKIGLDMGVEPGAEMKAAVEEAESRGLAVALIDRDIRITLRRFWKSLSLLEKARMLYALAVSVASIDDEKIDVEALKQQDMVEVAMEEFRKFSPNGARALIDERDAYLSQQLIGLSGSYERVLAVVGAGHVKGIQGYLDHPGTLPPLQDLNADVKSIPWGTIFGAGVTALFIYLLLAIAFSGVGLNVLMWALVYWVLVHGVLTAAFTLAARGHPLSALTGFAVSWFTALNPLIAAGWFSAIVEAKIRKPQPSDFRRIFQADTFTAMMDIPLFRVVLVAALANVGSTIGTVAYFAFIFPVLGIDPAVLVTQGTANMWHAFLGLFG
jgi:pheromone shutdown-related protein TraB